MVYKKPCISQQLISANLSIQEGFIAHVLIEMIDPSELFLVEMNVWVIHRVGFFLVQNITKTYQENVWVGLF